MSLKLKAKLVAFFLANPDEELLVSDVSAKFSVPLSTARAAAHALAGKSIVRIARAPHDGGVGAPPLVISAGPAILGQQAEGAKP